VKDEPKTRVVTFRLSEKEYEALRSACGIDRSSISAITRSTVLAWAETISARPKVDQRLADIDDRLDALCKLLSRTRDE
jgi:hypothetical protein